MRAFGSSAVEAAYQSFPIPVREKLLHLRELIFQTAAAMERVGPLEETLKWGEPAYLTSVTKSGSTIRLGWKKSTPAEYAMYFNCKTSLIESFRIVLPHEFHYEGNRAIIFKLTDNITADTIGMCIAAALTYHCPNK